MLETESQSAYLDPSELGTKEYWDQYYQKDLENRSDNEDTAIGPLELESWFDDVNAPAKVLKFLTSASFPLSPAATIATTKLPSVLDLGTGNGSSLFSLRLEGNYAGRMVGLDYSQQSVDLATKLWKQYCLREEVRQVLPADIDFYTADLLRDDCLNQAWWPTETNGFDLVLDKGTFDAISLSSEVITGDDGLQRRMFETYPTKIVKLIAPEGFLLITSCNWTEAEVIKWFTGPVVQGSCLEVYETIKYPTYEFGGQKGQGVASVCFRRTVSDSRPRP